jgi:predicted SnoaL-like aldol condensation-catalyzing enzyme
MTIPTQLERNKAIVSDFYELALNQRNFEAASKYLGAKYKQHNPLIEDGVEGLKQYLLWIRDNFPDANADVLRVFAEGDTVILHVHRVRSPGSRGDAIVDLFRVEDGKVVEHWDVIQALPESSKNENGMFY